MTREVGIFSTPPANDANKREYFGTYPKDTSMTSDFEGARHALRYTSETGRQTFGMNTIRNRCSPFTRILNDSRLFASFAGYVKM